MTVGAGRGVDTPHAVPAGEVALALHSDPAAGLGAAEAARRLAQAGPNELRTTDRVSAWRRLLTQLRDPLVVLLLVAVVVSATAWWVEGRQGTPFEPLVILAIVLINAVLGLVQEQRAERAVAALQRMAQPAATVVRDGRPLEVPARDVVPGDLLVLAEGDAVPADARLLEAATLLVAEAALTGESQPVLKAVDPVPLEAALGDRLGMVFGGTVVTRGRGRAVVTATGMATELGRIAGLLEATPDTTTPLQREIAVVGRLLGGAVVVISVVVVATVLLVTEIRSAQDLVDVLLLGVSLAVAAVPEGLPAVLSVVLALGVQRMAARHAIVKRLSSVETLGSASVICTDKTGTLTANEMTVRRVVTPSGEVEISGTGYDPAGRAHRGGRPLTDPVLHEEVRLVLGGGSLSSDARLLRSDDGGWTVVGDPTEGALLVAQQKVGLTPEALDERFDRAGELPFTSERKLMSTVQADTHHGGRLALVTKGAPDVLLARCHTERYAGEVRPLSPGRREEVLAGVDRMAREGLRTLAVAYRPLVEGEPAATEAAERDLIYLGMVGILDPPREEAARAIAEARGAGIRVVMITGDHPETAASIAATLALGGGGPVVTGPDLAAASEPALRDLVRDTSVFARVAPEHKLLIVAALQGEGHVVAMTGDGVNDAPALKAADIGVAMGVAGTDVAKEAADLILTDDDVGTIVSAVREGRAVLSNIRKFLRYLLSSNLGEVLTVFLGIVLAGPLGLLSTSGGGVPTPLLAVQILWINLLTDSLPALAMGVDPPAEDLMHRPPRPRTARIIDRAMRADIVLAGAVMAAVTLLTLDLHLPGGLVGGDGDLAGARTAAFTTLVLAQLFNAFNARSDHVSAFHALFGNPWLWGAVAGSALLQVAVVHLPVLNAAFRTQPLSLSDWAGCLALASAVLWVEEVKKVVVRAASGRGREPARADRVESR